jgi:hypothetical protein
MAVQRVEEVNSIKIANAEDVEALQKALHKSCFATVQFGATGASRADSFQSAVNRYQYIVLPSAHID